MDSHNAGSPASSPAKGRGIKPRKAASGRGVTKPKAKRGGLGGNARGRGRQMVFADPRVQAAHDRQKHLRELYSEVASAIKPALDLLAAETLRKTIASPTYHEQTPEFALLQRQLDDRLEQVIGDADRELELRKEIALNEFEHQTSVSQKKYHESFNHATEDFYDASLRRAAIVGDLHNARADINTPDPTYTYSEKPNEVIGEQGLRTVYRNGVEVPFPSLLDGTKKAAVAKGTANKGKPILKRRGDEQIDGQPPSKKSSAHSGSAKLDGDESPIPQPLHTKSLLSAETEPDLEPESNAASPTPESGPKSGASRKKKQAPAIPDGASEPDQWGVRVVTRKGQKANNRLIVPPTFTFTEGEIGIRASTRKQTGEQVFKYAGPNPDNVHLDRIVISYDCLTYEEDALDPALVEKHNLHPKYGLFVPGSRNRSEAPKPFVSGSNPIVVTTSNGATLQASRSVRNAKMDAEVRGDQAKSKLAFHMNQFCAEEGVLPDEIKTEEMRERERQRETAHQGQDEGEDSMEKGDGLQKAFDEGLAHENVGRLLSAAVQADADQHHLPPNTRSSRPYDAVRDVFTNMDPTPPPAMPVEVDTFRLSTLADVAESLSQQREVPFGLNVDHPRLEPQEEYRHDSQLGHHPNAHYEYGGDYIPDHRSNHHLGHRLETELPSLGDSMIDPRLRGHANPVPQPSNAFLQTALNPTPALTHIAPAPPPGAEPHPQIPLGRNPFTGLPPLRPSRLEKGMDSTHAPPPALVQQTAEFASSAGMIQPNSGTYFPPPHTRPYHQPYGIPEQGTMPPMHFPAPGGGMAAAQQPHHRPSYPPTSPIALNHAQVGAMPMHMNHGSPASPPGSSMGLRSPTGPHGGRHRSSFSTGSVGPVNNKYRKIAAAPIPHNRPWQGNGGAELRLAHYDHRESIKDYPANEPPPRTGPTTIRGWSVNNAPKGRRSLRKEDAEEKEATSINPYIGKWHSTDTRP